MDDEARARFRSRWRELLEGDPTKSRIYKDMGNGVATAGIEYYLPLFFDETATVFDYLGDAGHRGAARRPGARLPALLAGHARSLPAGARRSRSAGAAAGGAVPVGRAVLCAAPTQHAQLALRGVPTGATAPYCRVRRPARPGRGARRGRAAGQLQGAPAQHAAPRAGAGRERRPARKPARLPARQPPVARRPSTRWQEFQASDEKLGIATAALARGLQLARRRHRLRHRDRAVRRRPDHAPAQEAGAGQRRRGADQGPVRAERRRPGGARRSTASAATRAWSTWTWARANEDGTPLCRNSCTWNTPTRPRCTCR